MTSPSLPLPTDAELRILQVLWSHGAQTVREVHRILGETRDVRYTTVLKILQNMHQKRLVARDDSARSHVYQANVDRKWANRIFVSDLAERVFDGSTAGLVIGALQSKASKEELEKIREYLAELEEEGS